MPYRRFLTFELVAALLWNIGFALAGYFVGAEYDRIMLVIERGGWVLLGLAVGAFVVYRFVLRRRGLRRRARSARSST